MLKSRMSDTSAMISKPTTAPPSSRLRRLAAVLGAIVFRLTFALFYLWCLGAIWYSNVGPGFLRAIVVAAFALGFPLAWYRSPRTWIGNRRYVSAVFYLTAVTLIIAWQFKRPGNEGNWSPDVAVLSWAEFAGDRVTIHNIRDCEYRSIDDYDVRRYDATFDLNELSTVHFLVEPFSSFRGPAHTMLAFGFSDGRHFAISVELRKEIGEAFHPLPGFFKQFELIYVVGDERDLIRLRTDHRKHEVYFYPIKATPADKRKLLTDMLNRANALRERPEFYNTLTSSCTTNIVDHVNKLIDGPRPFNLKVLLPAMADELAYEMGLIDTALPFDEAKRFFRIDQRAQQDDGTPFSQRIRVR